MRRILIFTLLLTLCINSFCQVSVVVKAGINLSSYSGLNSNEKDLQEYRPGYMFSAGVEIPLVASLYVEPSLTLVQKGAQFSGTSDEDEMNMRVCPTYIELPVMLGYKFPILENVRLTIHAGPYISYGFGGKWKYEIDGDKYDGDAFGNTLGIEKQEAFSKKRWDYGVGAGAGLEIDRFLFRASYAFGLAKVKRDISGDIKNRGLAFAIGYRF